MSSHKIHEFMGKSSESSTVYIEGTDILRTKEAPIWKLLFWGRFKGGMEGRQMGEEEGLRIAIISCLGECS